MLVDGGEALFSAMHRAGAPSGEIVQTLFMLVDDDLGGLCGESPLLCQM